ncbi:MAG: helix-turn-helix transcriptional regulator [Parasporobacterium sp.]|nr:helix-turn-helix transcriptional regulator [Parasporobacterium sp.]
MDKISISPEIGIAIKEYRTKKKIRAKELAEHIGKTPAYISKLENGDFKTIKQDSFQKIVAFISGGDSEGYQRFIDHYLSHASNDELRQQLEIMNYDMIQRELPIPSDLVALINSEIHELGISSEDLVNYINQNDDYDNAFFKKYKLVKSDIPLNEFYPIPAATAENSQQDDEFMTIILYHLTPRYVASILSGRRTSCPHFVIYAIVYNILKLKNPECKNTEERWQLKTEASQILIDKKLYALFDKSRYFANHTDKEQRRSFLNSQDILFAELMEFLYSKLEELSEKHINYVNEKLSAVCSNFEKDISFALSFAALDIRKISDLSVPKRREFLETVNSLIEEFSAIPHSFEDIEMY